MLPQAELIEAVDGRNQTSIPDVATLPGNLHRPHYPFPLRPAEIGVFQSHRRCWQTIVDRGWDWALIAEDDLQVDPEKLATALDLVARHGSVDMYVRLPVKARETPAQVLGSAGDMQFILPRVIGLQCICQVVGRHAAARLLAVTAAIDRPVDTLLQMHWVTGQPIHAILPNGNAEVAHQIGGSTIQVKTRAAGKLLRELNRAWYRAQVALRPQKQ
ncbi:Glycosyltransferase involved in LPS biosynthesis, GR25 family [Sedimentitalea nanhaiensis]|uniref:Glycosyltransferase involved in LPS biosynthesis, GR25 family n=2 Tax=Sedimentitalea nanhaiensis TaxID=999627 RepID=A0A1I6XCA4_9RHOB|nr:Glycosyltransferase involved in LPS biosynthesis, GR25 family [Sedimentitalea nanhaiensis]